MFVLCSVTKSSSTSRSHSNEDRTPPCEQLSATDTNMLSSNNLGSSAQKCLCSPTESVFNSMFGKRHSHTFERSYIKRYQRMPPERRFVHVMRIWPVARLLLVFCKSGTLQLVYFSAIFHISIMIQKRRLPRNMPSSYLPMVSSVIFFEF